MAAIFVLTFICEETQNPPNTQAPVTGQSQLPWPSAPKAATHAQAERDRTPPQDFSDMDSEDQG